MSRIKLYGAILLGAFFIQGAVLITRTSPTTDEVAFHMVNGYAYLKTHDYRMSPANPALLREWMALPWLWWNPRLDLSKASWQEADSVPFSVDFFYRDNRAMADKLLYSSRVMILLLGTLLGWLIFDWSCRLYGPWAGLLSLALYSFCPSFIAHSAIAHTDIGVSLFVFWSGFTAWKYSRSGKLRHRFTFCVLFALSAACKYHALFFGPIFLLAMALKRGWRDAAKTTLLLGAVFLTVIWASYLFDLKPILSPGVPRAEEKIEMLKAGLGHWIPGSVELQKKAEWAAYHLPIPAPSYFLGLAGILRSHQAPYLHYAFGEWTTRAQPFYYFFSFAVKMTLPFLILLLVRTFFWKRPLGGGYNALLILFGAPAAWFLALMRDSTGVGVRYLFPVIPFLFVWIGALAAIAGRRKWPAVLLGMLVLWNVSSALATFPDYLSYFNESVEGVAGGLRYVRGSDVDWGQGLKELKRYLDDRGVEKVTLRYFGTADPSFYRIRFTLMDDSELIQPMDKVYAISLYYLEHAAWTKKIPPTAIVGGIAVYDFRKYQQGYVMLNP